MALTIHDIRNEFAAIQFIFVDLISYLRALQFRILGPIEGSLYIWQ